MRILLSIILSIICTLTLNAQLKYRAKEDFGLKGKVKVMKIITQSIENGDTVFGMFGGVKEHYFSENGKLQKIHYTNSNIPQNGTSTYKYTDTLIFVYSSSDTSNKDLHVIDLAGRVKFSTSIPKSYNPGIYTISQLKRKSTFLFTHYYYNKGGLLEESITYEPDNKLDTAYLNSQHLYKHNRKELLEKEIIKLNDNKGNRTITYKYNKERRLIKETYKFNDSVTSLRNDMVSNYRYLDNSFKKIEKVTTSTISTYKYFRPKRHTTHRQYDDKGNIIKEEEYDVGHNGENLVSITTFQIEYYD